LIEGRFDGVEEGSDEVGIMDLNGKFFQDISVGEIMSGETGLVDEI